MEELQKQLDWAKTQDWYPQFQQNVILRTEKTWNVMAIIDIFEWISTKEGHSFWSPLHDFALKIATPDKSIPATDVQKLVLPPTLFPEIYI